MKEILDDINGTITNLEKLGFYKEAEKLDQIFIKIAQTAGDGLFPGLMKAVAPTALPITNKVQLRYGNWPIQSAAYNKSIQLALGLKADGVWGNDTQNAIMNFAKKYPSDYDARLSKMVKPVANQQMKMPEPSGYTGP